MNNKIVSVVLVAGIAATGFAGLSSASDGASGSIFGNKAEVRELFNKVEAGETLTADEQATLDSAQAMRGEKGAKFGGKRKGGGNLSDEEKTALEAMSDEERQAFFETKKAEMKAEKESAKIVVDKLINGESLTAAEEATRGEMLMKMEEGNHKKGGSDIIAKILAGDELTADEETQLVEMQAKHAEREAQRALIEPIKAKLDAGEELSDEEQALLDEAKENRKGGKYKRGNHADRG